jgi:hypothetical protein
MYRKLRAGENSNQIEILLSKQKKNEKERIKANGFMSFH